jgi:hypothetical protein
MSKVVRVKADGEYLSTYNLIINLSILSSVYLIYKFGVSQSYFFSFIFERLPLKVKKPLFTFFLAV